MEALREELAKSQDTRKLLELALKQAETAPEEMRREIRLLDPTSVDTTEAITLKIGEEEFAPSVAYAIFPADYVRGYSEPRLTIEFEPVSLLAHVSFQFKEKLSDDADALGLLKPFMPDDTFYDDREGWTVACAKAKEEAIEELSAGKEISSLNAATVTVLKLGSAYVRRIFTFCLFFIEGAQFPDFSDKTWDVYVVHKKTTNEFLGYSSVYTFFYYSSATEFEAEGSLWRKRIGHFLILPPFQGGGLGRSLYLALVKLFVHDAKTREIEVEEPSATFDLLRDRCHYEWLTSEAKDLLEEYLDDPNGALEKLHTRFKLAPVQFQRVAEMLEFMSNGQKESARLKRMIKERLYKHNYTDLSSMDPATQRDQLHVVYENVLHGHKVALHLEEEEEEEEEEEDENDMMLARLLNGDTSLMSMLDPKRRKVGEDE